MNIIPLFSGGSSTSTSMLAGDLINFKTSYNYEALAWELDLSDINGNVLAAGLMLFPNVNIIKPYPILFSKYGALVPIEQNIGDYQNPTSLGNTLILLWYPVGESMVLPT